MWQHCHTYKTHTSAHTSGAIAMCRQSVPYGVVSVQTSTLVHSPTTSENFSVCWNTTDFLFLVLHQSPRSFCCLCTCCTLAVASSPGSFPLSAHERRELGDEDTLAGSWVLGMCIHCIEDDGKVSLGPRPKPVWEWDWAAASLIPCPSPLSSFCFARIWQKRMGGGEAW